MADTLVSKASAERCVGSTPISSTINTLPAFLGTLIIFLGLSDTFSTMIIMNNDFNMELNFIMRWVLINTGLVGFVIVKGITTIFMAYMTARYWDYRITKIGTWTVIICYAPIVIMQYASLV